MPQLIAMVIVVVAAMIYMFQTFGGTGDKIEGIAQKGSIITEINNIKSGIQLALRAESIKASDSTVTGKVKSLEGIAELEYFPEQINNQLNVSTTTDSGNVYKAISFGADSTLEITMVLPAKSIAKTNTRPGLFIDLTKGSLATNAGFLEKQLKADLEALGAIDTHATTAAYNALGADGAITALTAAGTNTDIDGKFVIYFKDLPRGMIDNN